MPAANDQGLKWWPAPAKLNLFLHVTGRRSDGFHDLQTLFQLLDWGDELAFEVTDDGSIERVEGPAEVPAATDLCLRAAAALQRNRRPEKSLAPKSPMLVRSPPM